MSINVNRVLFDIFRSKQSCRRLANAILKCILLNEIFCLLLKPVLLFWKHLLRSRINIRWYHVQCILDIPRSLSTKNSRNTPYNSPMRARYGVSYMIFEPEWSFAPLFFGLHYRVIMDRNASRVAIYNPIRSILGYLFQKWKFILCVCLCSGYHDQIYFKYLNGHV